MRPRKCCGSTAREHAEDCDRAVDQDNAKAEAKSELQELPLEDLLELRDAVRDELQRRHEEAISVGERIAKALAS